MPERTLHPCKDRRRTRVSQRKAMRRPKQKNPRRKKRKKRWLTLRRNLRRSARSQSNALPPSTTSMTVLSVLPGPQTQMTRRHLTRIALKNSSTLHTAQALVLHQRFGLLSSRFSKTYNRQYRELAGSNDLDDEGEGFGNDTIVQTSKFKCPTPLFLYHPHETSSLRRTACSIGKKIDGILLLIVCRSKSLIEVQISI